MSRNGHSVARSAHITGSNNQRAIHSRSKRRRSEITAPSTVSCEVQFEFLVPPQTNEGWIATKFASRSSDIRYRDGGDNVSRPYLIADERAYQIGTFTRSYSGACCACGWRSAVIAQKARHNDERDRLGLNCAASRAGVEHRPVIQRCTSSLGSQRIQISETGPTLVFAPPVEGCRHLSRRASEARLSNASRLVSALGQLLRTRERVRLPKIIDYEEFYANQ